MRTEDLLSYAVGALFLMGLLCVSVELIRAAFTGKFPYWRRKANGRRWPPLRSESSVRFWIAWTFMAGPILWITALATIGLVGAAFGE